MTNSETDVKGYVYVLSNPAMPGIVKIGYSAHGGKGRADTLYKNDTGVPMPFELEFEIYVANAAFVEKVVHDRLSSCRINTKREFFKGNIKNIVGCVLGVAMESMQLEVESFPHSIAIKDQWEITQEEINQKLAANGFDLVDQEEYAIEISQIAFDSDVVGDYLLARRTYTKKYLEDRATNKIPIGIH